MAKQNKLLVVDDDQINIQMITSALNDEYEILTADNGYDAINLLKKQTPDLILLDVMMPEFNGFDVCNSIKADASFVDIPVIFLTSMDDPHGELLGLEAGGIDYLPKPVNLKMLKLRVRNHIALKERNDLLKEQRDLLLRQKEELQNINNELDRFTYTISHDLKSPLITIQTYAGMIKQDMASGNLARAQEDINTIENTAAKMATLLEAILALSRVGKMMDQPSQIDMNLLIRETLEQLSGSIEKRPAEIIVQPELPAVFSDRVRISEVVQNLIENAIKYMGDQATPRIEIGARQEDNKWVFFVGDNGKGVDPQYHEKIFGLFNKLDTKSEGSGIGLALVKRIIEVHGGRVWVESEGMGKGSIFCFTLPGTLIGSVL